MQKKSTIPDTAAECHCLSWIDLTLFLKMHVACVLTYTKIHDAKDKLLHVFGDLNLEIRVWFIT